MPLEFDYGHVLSRDTTFSEDHFMNMRMVLIDAFDAIPLLKQLLVALIHNFEPSNYR